MNTISAFVGHSFSAEDAQLVRGILDFLETVKDALPNFSWVHAEKPEAKIVAEKVLGLLVDKNLLIAICTKKELVVSAKALKKKLLSSTEFSVAKMDLNWKTSDWVIQEIGLAVGLGLKVILLLEEGVRVPGAIQGNLEYIEFNRAAPELAFPKLLAMIAAISPQPRASGASTQAAPPEDSAGPAESSDSHFFAPKADWTIGHFEAALIRAVALDIEGGEKELDQAYRMSPHFGTADNAAAWSAFREATRFSFGKEGSISRLKEIVAENPKSVRALGELGKAYESLEEYAEAAAAFEQAAKATPGGNSAIWLARAYLARTSAGQDQLAEANWVGLLKCPKSDDSERIVLEAIRSQFEGDDSHVAFAALTERLLELSPDDNSVRFSLAYRYSEAGRHELSLLHYLRIAPGQRGGVAWNNLGVSFADSGMPAKAVESYRAARSAGETLAVSNLAQIFMKAGFIEEALALCNEAIQVPDHHRNVDSTLSSIKGVPEAEEKKRDEVLGRARPISQFLKQVGRAMAVLPENFPRTLTAKDCPLVVTRLGNRFSATGEFTRIEPAGLMRLAGQSDKEVRFKTVYEGKIVGGAIVGTTETRKDDESLETVLGTLGGKKTFVAWIDEAGKRLEVCERVLDGNPRYVSMPFE